MAVVGLDIGGTWTRVAAAGAPPTRFPTAPGYATQISTLVAAVPAGTTAVGVSFGGRVTADGDVRIALNLRAYEGRPLGRDLAAALGCPVRVAHDATCGLLGEHTAGALRGFSRCGYLTLSTGVGAALRLGGVALTTEAGHQLVRGNELPCACGQTGCLETLIGGSALRRRLGRPLEELEDVAFWEWYAQNLAPGIANFALAAGLDAVALGGAIAMRGASLWDPLWRELGRILTYQSVSVVPAALGDAAPLAGARQLVTLPPPAVLH